MVTEGRFDIKMFLQESTKKIGRKGDVGYGSNNRELG